MPAARRILFLVAMLIVSRAGAADAPPQLRQGYAFDRPPILIQQHLFGLAHGVALLADACAQEPAHRDATEAAYRQWHARQASVVETATRDLAHYYFGDRAGDATHGDIAHALRLKDRLDLTPGSTSLREACATFPQVLRNPRYDLMVQYRLQLMAARLETGTMIEAAAGACRTSLPSQEVEALDTVMAKWHAEHATEMTEARASLEAEWSALQWQGTLDQFVKAARQRGKMSATRERCKALARLS